MNDCVDYQSAVQHAHATDRFAREIIAILTLSYAARSRRLMRNPLGGDYQTSSNRPAHTASYYTNP